MRKPLGMTSEPNVFDFTTWEREMGSARGTRLGPGAGAVDLGCSIFELDAGAQAAPYHAHYANEELLILLDGTLELRTPAGLRRLEKGAIVAFPAGPGGAHRVRNCGDGPARYLMISTMKLPEVAEQLDTGTLLAMTAPGGGYAFPKGSDASYMELTIAAIQADPGGDATD